MSLQICFLWGKCAVKWRKKSNKSAPPALSPDPINAQHLWDVSSYFYTTLPRTINRTVKVNTMRRFRATCHLPCELFHLSACPGRQPQCGGKRV